jgi:hypothetical protein
MHSEDDNGTTTHMTIPNGSIPAALAEELAAFHRGQDAAMRQWAAGYGPIRHSAVTQLQLRGMADLLAARDLRGDAVPFLHLLHAADRVASAAMCLVVHQTYAKNVYIDGRSLSQEDFKDDPEGHTGGSLNMVPACALEGRVSPNGIIIHRSSSQGGMSGA